ncbi:DUF2165 family protein [Paraburkholderia youngii]|uniref:DUF2165 family protein n=1 Tax=Paraburkholderia youngii TaxID=2782701 RepID=UPI003D2257D4
MIAMQIRTAALCWLGGLKLMRARHDGDATFLSARGWAISGLTLGFLTWQVIFMMIGGEWFGMWTSSHGTASKPLFCFFVTFLLVLIYLVMADDENGRPATPHRRSSEPGLNAAAVDQPSREGLHNSFSESWPFATCVVSAMRVCWQVGRLAF